MSGPIHRFLGGDHVRLDGLLREAARDPGRIDPAPYALFRRGLLKHIAMEEKILLPAMQRLRGGEPLPIAVKLRLDHGAIAALLVPTPSAAVVRVLQAILDAHNPLEEGPGGLYETCDALAAGEESASIIRALEGAREVPVAPHNDEPRVTAALRRALERAGYDFDALARSDGGRPPRSDLGTT